MLYYKIHVFKHQRYIERCCIVLYLFHLMEYSEYDNIDYDKIYMTNLLKNVTTF